MSELAPTVEETGCSQAWIGLESIEIGSIYMYLHSVPLATSSLPQLSSLTCAEVYRHSNFAKCPKSRSLYTSLILTSSS